MAVKIIGAQKARPVRDNTKNEQSTIELFVTPSTLETVDRAIFEFIDEELNIHFTKADQKAGKVPVIWNSAERACSGGGLFDFRLLTLLVDDALIGLLVHVSAKFSCHLVE